MEKLDGRCPLSDIEWDVSVKRVAQQVKHYLIALIGKTEKDRHCLQGLY